MEHIKIKSADIIFQEISDGKGKIIISDDVYGYNFSYSWNAMGKNTSLKSFLKKIDADYFSKKLCNNLKGNLSIKKTFVSLRKYIKDCIEYDLMWYNHVEFQKDFRKKLNLFQSKTTDENYFINNIKSFYDELDFALIKDYAEREKIEKLFFSIFKEISEPWGFLYFNDHDEVLYLKKLHSDLKKTLSKPIQLCLF